MYKLTEGILPFDHILLDENASTGLKTPAWNQLKTHTAASDRNLPHNYANARARPFYNNTNLLKKRRALQNFSDFLLEMFNNFVF